MRYPVLIANGCWLVITGLLIAGVSQPMFTFSKFYFFNDTFSLLGGIFHLATQGEILLFLLLFSFSLVMPAIKMAGLLYAINQPPGMAQRYLHKIAWLGKWSMLDVFVVAILAVTVKLGIIANIEIHPGLYIFAAAVLLSMLMPMVLSVTHNSSPRQPSMTVQTPTPHRHITFYQCFVDDILAGNKVITIRDTPEASPGELLDVYTHEENRWFAKIEITGVSPIQLSQLAQEHAEQENMTLEQLHQTIESIYPGQQQLYVLSFQRR